MIISSLKWNFIDEIIRTKLTFVSDQSNPDETYLTYQTKETYPLRPGSYKNFNFFSVKAIKF